ncbi:MULTISPECIES: DUF6440 family protein [Breznakia]|uniref:DUF6440 domain-containing protein n=1 Tax=Breznakia blatticola TaxID=1754012 RepID=A0A4R7ZCH4_9FIRM|nr:MULTISPECIES: DUF6440 family protein [Breznakia]MDH6365958.1 hypothetical protein [Breznakia sp. PH1-1]MDH6403110.1 hypothetical protein [Breznakia sp. PF1-11]MDH6410819.1 hypothetical protein [Breznakia sp. PFB1-11]MDH6413124.1 hypothetical protein [Breznakia sp. PFB1-14]MDH6415492.1 hypothetical protein [Breznakia sp. PFB1-4]
MRTDKERFVIVHEETTLQGIRILEDQITGVNYLLVNTPEGSGLTPLLDSHGNVVITKYMMGEIDSHQ